MGFLPVWAAMWFMCILTPARAVVSFSECLGSSPTVPPLLIPAMFQALLIGANLREANLEGASVTREQLAACESLQGDTMPGGSKQP